MFERIVVGVDVEGASDHAIAAAGRLADRGCGEVAFLHAIPLFWRSWSKPAMVAWEASKHDVMSAARESIAQRIDAVLAQDGHPVKDVGERLQVVEDSPGHALLRHSRPGDLLVLGRHRHDGIFHFGSSVRTVLAKADVPIWIQTEAPRPIERLLVAVDMSSHTEAVVRVAGQVCERLGVGVTLLHGFEAPTFAYGTEPAYTVDSLREDSRAAFDKFADDARLRLGSDLQTVFCEGVPADDILEFARPSDLVVMGTHGHSGVLRVVLGSQAYRVIKRAKTPVLVVPCSKRQFVAA